MTEKCNYHYYNIIRLQMQVFLQYITNIRLRICKERYTVFKRVSLLMFRMFSHVVCEIVKLQMPFSKPPT